MLCSASRRPPRGGPALLRKPRPRVFWSGSLQRWNRWFQPADRSPRSVPGGGISNLREPEFWKPGANPWPARALLPASSIYALATALRRWRNRPYRPPVPVVVAGGLTLGGSGKTPLALALAERLVARNPHFITRGYGGRSRGPLSIDPSRHSAAEVGDE